ncbi:MAG TPA: cupin domain-containing protein [Gaiellales bacterium]|nr:cupin domain-containing protein [Gaiellales bacterium]
MRKFNLLAPEFDHASERDGYRWRSARVAQAVGGEQVGARLYDLGDGQRSNPYHFHHAVEEWLIVVAGSPTLRTPEGQRELREGDVICFPVGPGGTHQVTGPGTVLLLSANHEPDAIEYPDSGKIQLSPSGQVFRLADAVDFWDGE